MPTPSAVTLQETQPSTPTLDPGRKKCSKSKADKAAHATIHSPSSEGLEGKPLPSPPCSERLAGKPLPSPSFAPSAPGSFYSPKQKHGLFKRHSCPATPRMRTSLRCELEQLLHWHQEQIVQRVVEEMAMKLPNVWGKPLSEPFAHQHLLHVQDQLVESSLDFAESSTCHEPDDEDKKLERKKTAGSIETFCFSTEGSGRDEGSGYVTIDEERIRISQQISDKQAAYTLGGLHHSMSWMVVSNAVLHNVYVRKLIENGACELMMAIVILSDTVLIGIESEFASQYPSRETPTVFFLLRVLFVVIYCIELSIRLCSNSLLDFFCHSPDIYWNWFDSFVLVCSLGELMINTILLNTTNRALGHLIQISRVIRLIRILRIARVVRFIKGLKMLIISILSTLQTLGWALILLVLIIYCYAIVLAGAVLENADDVSQTDKSELDRYWGSLRTSMYTLFMAISGGVSWEVAVMPLARVDWIWGAAFTSFIAFAYFAVLNVMTGVFCQSALETASRNHDLKWHDMMAKKKHLVAHVERLFSRIDGKSKGELEYEQVLKCWHSNEMQAFFVSMDLNPDDAFMFYKVLDADGEGTVSADEFVQGCLRLKGEAKAFDIAVMSYELKHLGKQLVHFMNDVQTKMKDVHAKIDFGVMQTRSITQMFTGARALG